MYESDDVRGEVKTILGIATKESIDARLKAEEEASVSWLIVGRTGEVIEVKAMHVIHALNIATLEHSFKLECVDSVLRIEE